MKFYLIAAAGIILFSSCLKESIPDAMLASRKTATAGITATLSYKLNGKPVKITLADALHQNQYTHSLYCRKQPATADYILSGDGDAGETSFFFLTDSLTTTTYTYPGGGNTFLISYYGENEYAHAMTDSLSFTISSFKDGLINGTFSGILTPYILDSNSNGSWGVSGSTKITEGTFQNVPVFY